MAEAAAVTSSAHCSVGNTHRAVVGICFFGGSVSSFIRFFWFQFVLKLRYRHVAAQPLGSPVMNVAISFIV
jgi:hypothetical protein